MTKQDIYEATLELACEKGLGSISMSQIAERVKLKKSSLYSHFSSKDEIVKGMYEYFREKAKAQNSNTVTDYGSIVEGKSLKELLLSVVNSYRKMNSSTDMNRFYRLIMCERVHSETASGIMLEETRKMIAATKNLFYAASAKGIAVFENPDTAALSFAMGIHALLDYECDAENVGSDETEGLTDSFIDEFCRIYAKG